MDIASDFQYLWVQKLTNTATEAIIWFIIVLWCTEKALISYQSIIKSKGVQTIRLKKYANKPIPMKSGWIGIHGSTGMNV